MRDLLYNTTTNAQNGTFSSDDHTNHDGNNVLEYIGFLAWYLILVLCCIIPPCLAYRRRRIWDREGLRANYLHRISDHGVLIRIDVALEEMNEGIRMERTRRIVEALKGTTMVVKEKHLSEVVNKTREQPQDNVNHADVPVETEDDLEATREADDLKATDEENGKVNLELETTLLQLDDIPNGNRVVAGSCAICLCPYEVDDLVCVSPNEHCVHAFHEACAVTWLSKKDQTLCPCCRQEFCTITPVHWRSAMPQTATNTTNNDRDDNSDDDDSNQDRGVTMEGMTL